MFFFLFLLCIIFLIAKQTHRLHVQMKKLFKIVNCATIDDKINQTLLWKDYCWKNACPVRGILYYVKHHTRHDGLKICVTKGITCRNSCSYSENVLLLKTWKELVY